MVEVVDVVDELVEVLVLVLVLVDVVVDELVLVVTVVRVAVVVVSVAVVAVVVVAVAVIVVMVAVVDVAVVHVCGGGHKTRSKSTDPLIMSERSLLYAHPTPSTPTSMQSGALNRSARHSASSKHFKKSVPEYWHRVMQACNRCLELVNPVASTSSSVSPTVATVPAPVATVSYNMHAKVVLCSAAASVFAASGTSPPTQRDVSK
jgi:hypothetical protein